MGIGYCQNIRSIDLRAIGPRASAVGDRAQVNFLPLPDRSCRFPTLPRPIARASARVPP